jgi:Lipid A 3-O-deacylase (PagL)
MFSTARYVGAGAFLLLLVSVGWAQSDFPPQQNPQWDLSVWIAGATGEEHLNSFTEAQIFSGGIFVGKVVTGEMGRGWRRGNLEFGMSVMPLFVHLTPSRLYGGGFEPVVLRWQILRGDSATHVRRVMPYIELAGGGVRTNANLPTGKTSDFNFTARGGGGIQILARERQAVDIGCRWWHISNANLGVQNPEFNGIQVSLGYHWFK